MTAQHGTIQQATFSHIAHTYAIFKCLCTIAMVLIQVNWNAETAGSEFLLWHGQLLCKDTQMHSIYWALSYSGFTAVTFPGLFFSILQRSQKNCIHKVTISTSAWCFKTVMLKKLLDEIKISHTPCSTHKLS
jgi:hypothetical protein